MESKKKREIDEIDGVEESGRGMERERVNE